MARKQDFKIGQIIAEGKTKVITVAENKGIHCKIKSKNDITAFDDPEKTKQLSGKAEMATNTTCNIFQLLKDSGLVKVAFMQQLSPTEFLAENCQMIPLEVVARRYAVGSYLQRFPNLKSDGLEPYRFHNLKLEFFLKTKDGRLKIGDKTIVEGLDPKKGEEDPLLAKKPGQKEKWILQHPKKPSWDPESNLNREININEILGAKNDQEKIGMLTDICRNTALTFLILESAWSQLNLRLIDFKIEFGINYLGQVVIADVIDNDSWRLRDENWKDISKESFRQGEIMSAVEKNYQIVSLLSERLRIPKATIVLWGNSNKEKTSDSYFALRSKGINARVVSLSGYKQTNESLEMLEILLKRYTEGGVIVVNDGYNNGLGPILAEHTSWPVISISSPAKDSSEKVDGILKIATRTPLATVWSENDAINLAFNILALKNPKIYALRQLEIEEFDIMI